MTITLIAAYSELEIIDRDLQDLQDYMAEPDTPEMIKCACELRLRGFALVKAMLNQVITEELEKADIGDVLSAIEGA